jgi:hypothetical protein
LAEAAAVGAETAVKIAKDNQKGRTERMRVIPIRFYLASILALALS